MFRFLTRGRVAAPALSLLGLAAVLSSGCALASPAQAATETPVPTATSTPSRAVSTAEPTTQPRTTTTTSGTDAARSDAAPGTGDVCNPCMVMEVSAAGQRFTGEVTARGREGSIEVMGFNYEVATPREAGSGLATGRRQYQPLLIRKRIDKATPLLAKAMIDNTPLSVTLKVYRAGADGQPEHYYTIKLEEVFVSSLSVFGFDPQPIQAAAARTFVMPHMLETSGSISASDLQQEEVSFSFNKITVTHKITKITVEDTLTALR